MPSTVKINWPRVVLGGLAGGVIINVFEYGGHRMFLDQAWTDAFRALGKTPTGWAVFIPANFLVGILMVWLYARIRPLYCAGPKTALRVGLAAWVVFWVIPLMAMVPLNLFPNDLLFMAIGLGVIDATLGAFVGAWLYRAA